MSSVEDDEFAPGLAKKPWREIARPSQLPPSEPWRLWALIGGRGSGKTRAGAEAFLERVRGGEQHLAVIAPTFSDARDVCVEGESGILACAEKGLVKTWNRSMGEIRFSTGAKAKTFAACEPDRLNGPQHGFIWGDEFGLWKPGIAAIDMALFGLRLGENPQMVLTSTPKPTPTTRYVIGLKDLFIHRMRTRDNVENLSPGVVAELERRYGGTRLGKQELEGELIDDVEGALWTAETILNSRMGRPGPVVAYVVAVDPSVADADVSRNPGREPDECGIVVAGIREDGTAHVASDLSGVYSPSQWARVAVGAYNHYRAIKIVAERNQGGEMVRSTLKTIGPAANIELVWAAQGKRPRAEPVAALYEQGRVTHGEQLERLEAEMTTWDASDPSAKSPNRLDALVWALHGLGLCDVTGSRLTSRIRTVREEV